MTDQSKAKFEAAIYRRQLQNRLLDAEVIAAQHQAGRYAASAMASLARQARRDGMADIAEIRRQAETRFNERRV